MRDIKTCERKNRYKLHHISCINADNKLVLDRTVKGKD